MAPRIIFGGDLGTKYGAIVALYVPDGDAPFTTTFANLVPIKLDVCDSGKSEFKQMILYAPGENGGRKLVFGRKVSEELRKLEPHFQNEVMEFFKLALHSQFDSMKEVAHVKKVFQVEGDRGRLEELYTDYLEAGVCAVRNHFKKKSPRADREIFYDNIRIEAQLCVPAIWGDEQGGVIRNAARKAGIARTDLREEPLCSATVSMHELLDCEGVIKEGQCSINFDCGSGTHDASVTRLDARPTNGQHMKLTRIAICSGNESGSQMLNHQLLLYLASDECPETRKHGGLENLCKMMKIQRREFERQASNEFDAVKERFPDQYDSYPLNVLVASSANADINDIVIRLPHKLVQQWYNVWIAKAVQLIRNHIDQALRWAAERPDGPMQLEIACVVFSGGGYRSNLLQKENRRAIEELLPRCWIYLTEDPIPCAKGALLQHYFPQHTLPSHMRFYLTRAEEYHPRLHGDTEPESAEWNNKVKVVPERLKCILKREDSSFFGQEFVPMTFRVDIPQTNGSKQQPRLHVDLYWSENHLEDHSPLRSGGDQLTKGIRSFPLAWHDIDDSDLEADGFELVTRNGGVPHYVVDAWVEMSYSDAQLALTVYLMKHGYKLPWKVDGKVRLARRRTQAHVKIPKTGAQLKQLNGDDILLDRTVEIWHKDSSHFITQSTGTCMSRGDHIKEDDN